MANYELMLIVDPSLSEDEIKNNLKEITTLVENNSWKVEKEDIWGEKKLSYKINKSEKGYYALYDLEINWVAIKDISKIFNLNKNIWRYMFVKKDS